MDREDLINGFFEGSLTRDQMDEFENLLETDPEFAKSYGLEKELKQALKSNERQDIKQMFRDLDQKEAENLKDKEQKVFRLRPLLMAASVALVIGLGSWLLFFNTQGVDADQLYDVNFTPYENVVRPIERNDQTADLETRAFIAYEEANYNLALSLFDELSDTEPEPYIDFYTAVTLMELGEHEKAIPLLKNYIGQKAALRDRAKWYLALAYLKLGDMVLAKQQLRELVQLGSFKKETAAELLEELD